MGKIKILKNKKQIKIGGIIFILLFFFLFFFLSSSKNYVINYNLDAIEVTESFDKNNQIYQFLFKKEDKEFIIEQKHKYVHKKKIVQEIEMVEENDTFCIIPKGKLDFYPLCYQNNELISYHLIENKDLIPKQFFKEIKLEKDEYHKIQINYLNNKKYFIWNYKGFDIIGKKNKTIELFDEDVYHIPLASKNKNTILLANYKEKYNFNKFYIINAKNNKIKEIDSEKRLSFDSMILGSYKNNYYFLDKKNKKEYEINTKKRTIENITKKNKGKILEEGTWKEVSINKLSQGLEKFTDGILFNYQLIENKLYLVVDDYKIRVSNLEVKDIIEIDEDTVYYLVDDQLYAFHPVQGEVLIMSYFEWNFNYKNMIYIF